jgi:hypothetical protein
MTAVARGNIARACRLAQTPSMAGRRASGLFALLSAGCIGASPSVSERAGLASDGSGQGVPGVDSPCGSPSWHVLRGASIGRGEVPAQHRASTVALQVESNTGFELGRSSVVRTSQGDQLLVELVNVEDTWRCGIRSYPSVAYNASGETIGDDIRYDVLGTTGMHITTREGILGSCLGPGEQGYLQIGSSAELAKVSLRLEAASDGMPFGPPPTCVVPEGYAYVAGALSIRAQAAGLADPTYKPAAGGGLALVLTLDAEQLPLALYSLAPGAADATAPTKLTFAGAISLNAGNSQSLAVLVW